jgi:hypothetical protein
LVEDLRDVYSHDLAAVFAVHFCRLIYEPSYAKSSGRGEARSAALPPPAWEQSAERLADKRSPGSLNSASGSTARPAHGVRQPAVRAASQFSERSCFASHEDGRVVHRLSWFNRKPLKNNIFFERRRTGWEIEGLYSTSTAALLGRKPPLICKCSVRGQLKAAERLSVCILGAECNSFLPQLTLPTKTL